MRENIKDRALKIAEYIIDTGATVRKAAAIFEVSKSTVHCDMTVRLPKWDKERYRIVKSILDKNREERHIRGGERTREKYRKMR